MGRDDVYPVSTSKFGFLLHYARAYVLNRLWHSAVDNRPWTYLPDIHHPDP